MCVYIWVLTREGTRQWAAAGLDIQRERREREYIWVLTSEGTWQWAAAGLDRWASNLPRCTVMYAYTYIHMYVYTYIHVYICMYTYINVCKRIYNSTNLPRCTVCMYLCMCVRVSE